MTECERLVAEGILDASFFEEEVRCGFKVDKERKKIWAVELALLLEVDRICKKYGLKYYLWSGTLLGAIRHNGFIPWDDDMDLLMFRDDYDRLMAHADEFRKPYFLQTPLTDPEAGYSHIKIRDCNTTAFNKLWGYRNYNQGIYIDIFPLDDKCDQEAEERFSQIKDREIESSLYMKMASPYKNGRDIERIANRSFHSLADNFICIQELATNYRNPGSADMLRWIATPFNDAMRAVYQRSDFDETVLVKYEGFSFPVPGGYEKILTKMYGNYMEFPPVEKRVNKHAHTVFDADIPYTEFKKPENVEEDEYYKVYSEYGRNKD